MRKTREENFSSRELWETIEREEENKGGEEKSKHVESGGEIDSS